MSAPTLEFLFDFISPYAFIAWKQLQRAARERNIAVHARPVLFAGLLEHHGHFGPAEIPAKRAFVIRDVLRLAHHADLALEFPPVFPFNSLLALRVASPQVAGDAQHDVIETLWRTAWERGRDVSRDEVVVAALREAGFEGEAMVAKTKTPEVKTALQRATADACAAGVFGVPTFLVPDGHSGRHELFWGSDRLEHALAFARGERIVDEERARAFSQRPALQRPAVVRSGS